MGYHKKTITKGTYGEFSKIREEFQELEDAYEQEDKILQLCELTDLVGAISGYANTLGFTLDDLIKFNNKTTNAFKDGTRN